MDGRNAQVRQESNEKITSITPAKDDSQRPLLDPYTSELSWMLPHASSAVVV